MIFSNRIAVFLWGFSLVWMLGMALFARILIADGPPPDASPPLAYGVFGIFCLAGVVMSVFAASKPCYFASVLPGGQVRFTWRHPHKRRTLVLPADQVPPPQVVTEKDSEGDPYFAALLTLPDGSPFRLAEGHDKARCEDKAREFAQAIRADTPQA